MKKLVLLFTIVLFYSATNTTTIRASEPYSQNFIIGFLHGTIPVLGHINAIKHLWHFSNSKHINLQERVMPGATGLITGTGCWFLAVELLKLVPNIGSWKPYVVPTIPGALVLATKWVEKRFAKKNQ